MVLLVSGVLAPSTWRVEQVDGGFLKRLPVGGSHEHNCRWRKNKCQWGMGLHKLSGWPCYEGVFIGSRWAVCGVTC